MAQEKITTNRIEEALLKKKINECTKEVKSAAASFANTINSYRPKESTDNEAFKTWVLSMFSYGWQVFVREAYIDAIPDYLKKQLLEQAVDEFIQSVESTKEVIDSLDI